MLETVVYISSASETIDSAGIEALLKEAHSNNLVHGITGVLLYEDGSFLQVLEGPGQILDRLLSAIEKDSRHKGMIVTYRASIESRAFWNWGMGLAKPEELLTDLPVFDFFKGDIDGIQVGASKEILTLLRQFHDSLTSNKSVSA